MSTSLTREQALQEAIKDYNLWASEKAKGYDVITAYSELRGIFYNKLLTRLRETPNFHEFYRTGLGKVILPEDFTITMVESAHIKAMNIRLPDRYCSVNRGLILGNLISAVPTLVFDTLPSPIEYKMQELVNTLKAYKHERTTTGDSTTESTV